MARWKAGDYGGAAFVVSLVLFMCWALAKLSNG